MNILICGFMGAGKSTFLRQINPQDAGYLSYDLDVEVTKELGILPHELGDWLRLNSMADFRLLEIEILKRLIRERTNKVIALGGGTPEAMGFEEIFDRVKMIYLDVPFEVCFERIKDDKNRPLVSLGRENLKRLYEERLPLYKKAHIILNEDEIKEIVSLEALVHNEIGGN